MNLKLIRTGTNPGYLFPDQKEMPEGRIHGLSCCAIDPRLSLCHEITCFKNNAWLSCPAPGVFSITLVAGFRNELKFWILKNKGNAVEGKIMESGKLYKNPGTVTYYIKMLYVREKGVDVAGTYQADRDDYDDALKTGSLPVTIAADHPKFSASGQSFGNKRGPLFLALVHFIFSFTPIVFIEIKLIKE